jgi:hypothetical protein
MYAELDLIVAASPISRMEKYIKLRCILGDKSSSS